MNASAHISAGLVAGMVGAHSRVRWIWRVATAFSLGLLSHVVFDAIPHSDYRMFPRSTHLWLALCEIAVVGVIAGFIVRRRLIPGWAGCLFAGLVGSALPDAKFAARAILPESIAQSVARYGDAFHSPFHAGRMSEPWLGLGIEIACAVVLLATLTVFPRSTKSVP